MRFLVVFAFLAITLANSKVSLLTEEAKNDLITSLPGGDALDVDFGFSGYLAVNGSSPGSKKLHYWFQPSENINPDDAPVAFWTNGGPGCSGLLGAMTEQGMFRAQADGTLKKNNWNWNKDINMIYIEQPCGVGFSYSSDEDESGKADDYTAGDASAAQDNYNLIQGFMTRFPQFAKSPLYLTSESYGGHYIPTLSKYVVEKNTEGKNPKLNFKGFAVGNPATTFESTTPAMVDAWWGHQVISAPVYKKYMEYNCLFSKDHMEECETLFLEMYKQTDTLNAYALDYPICLSSSDKALKKNGKTVPRRGQAGQLLRFMFSHLREEVKQELGLSHLKDSEVYEPCEDDYTYSYLNTESVKDALHVKKDVTWSDCSRKINYSNTDTMKNMTPNYRWLLANSDIDIMVYSGDDDSVCATSGTQDWIYDLGYETARKNTWQPWFNSDGEMAGFLTKFEKAPLAFATVHGAGHEVPTYKPEQALLLFQSFLAREVFLE